MCLGVRVYYGCGHVCTLAVEECQAGFSAYEDVCRQGHNDYLGTFYLIDEIVCNDCEEPTEDVEEREEPTEEVEDEQQTEAITFIPNPDGVGERIRQSPEPPSKSEVFEPVSPISHYSSVLEQAVMSDDAQRIIDMPCSEFPTWKAWHHRC